LKIGILVAGHTSKSLLPEFGDTPAMFQHLLDGKGYDWRTYDVPAGEYPAALAECDGYILTGAAAGVYDGDPWIGELMAFLRQAKGRTRLFGVCFGHQAMAQAFGGRVIKSPKGWGIGLHDYKVEAPTPWMDDAPDFALSASHQDQVIELPPGARVVAASDFSRYGMLAYDDGMAMSVQLHPEFAPAYSLALLEGRRGSRYPEALAAQAVESLKQPDDHVRFAGWVERFFSPHP
jgi:GMP synthase-like glutamine amidotransferase